MGVGINKGGAMKRLKEMFENENALPWMTFAVTAVSFHRDTWVFMREELAFWRDTVGFCIGK